MAGFCVRNGSPCQLAAFSSKLPSMEQEIDDKLPPNSSSGVVKPTKCLADIVVGGKDDREREILDLLWKRNQYRIYRHAEGISPYFSDNPDTADRQSAAYAGIRPHFRSSTRFGLLPICTGDR